MFNSNNGGYSLADIAAATNGGNGNGMGFDGGYGGWWIILLFIIAYGGGWGNGGFGGGGGNSGLQGAMNTDYLSNGIRDLQAGITNSFQTLNNELLNGFCDNRTAFAQNTADLTAAITNGFNTQNLTNLQNSNAIQRDIYAGTVGAMQNTQALQATLTQMESNNRADACAMNTNNANNTRDIIDAINDGNREILNTMTQNKFDAMQDRINDLLAQNQALAFAASQNAQTNDIVNTLRPSPTPAWVVQNPWASCNCGNYNTYASMMA